MLLVHYAFLSMTASFLIFFLLVSYIHYSMMYALEASCWFDLI